MNKRRGKYNVAPKEQRTFMGRVYASKAEAQYAHVLHLTLLAGEIRDVEEQPRTELGVPENVYIPDFLVTNMDGSKHYVDVKGMETPIFRRNKKLWASYGPGKLLIVKRTSDHKFKLVETVEPMRKGGK